MKISDIDPQLLESIDQIDDNDVDEAASAKLCKSTRSNASLGASNLASCKSQGYRRRSGGQKHTVAGKRIKMGGKKIKGAKYNGPLPDYSKK